MTEAAGRAALARRALVGAALLGVLADPLLRHEPWGLGLGLWMIVFALTVTVLARDARGALSRESVGWLGLAVLFAAGLAWRDAEPLVAFDVLAMLSSLVLLAMSLSASPVTALASARVRDIIRAAVETGLNVAGGVVPLVMREAQLDAPPRNGGTRRLGRAVLITLPVFAVFALLLTQADPVFRSLVTIPDLDLEVVFSHVVFAGFFAWIVAGWLRRSLFASPAGPITSNGVPMVLGATDVGVSLGALNVLFAAFVAVQVGWLFGGEALVVRTSGLTYAQYARRGFFELMWVGGLLLPVLLSVHAMVPDADAFARRLFRRLALPLVALLGAILASAGARMNLYMQYYGLSADRLYASAIIVWLAIVFLWLALTVLRDRPLGFASGFVLSAFAVLLALNVLNPDAMVARANLARGTPVRAGAAGADLPYVATLGGDAMAALVAVLTAPATAPDSAHCNAARIVLARWTGARPDTVEATWQQWNLARNAGRRAVREHEAQLRRRACAAGSGGAARSE